MLHISSTILNHPRAASRAQFPETAICLSVGEMLGDARFLLRRLADVGLADVRSGAVPPSAFPTDPASVQGLWADGVQAVRRPIGLRRRIPQASYHASKPVLAQLLPALNKRTTCSKTRSGSHVTTTRPTPHTKVPPAPRCFALTNDRAHALALMSTNPAGPSRSTIPEQADRHRCRAAAALTASSSLKTCAAPRSPRWWTRLVPAACCSTAWADQWT